MNGNKTEHLKEAITGPIPLCACHLGFFWSRAFFSSLKNKDADYADQLIRDGCRIRIGTGYQYG